jgi:hypothetical protein
VTYGGLRVVAKSLRGSLEEPLKVLLDFLCRLFLLGRSGRVERWRKNGINPEILTNRYP